MFYKFPCSPSWVCITIRTTERINSFIYFSRWANPTPTFAGSAWLCTYNLGSLCPGSACLKACLFGKYHYVGAHWRSFSGGPATKVMLFYLMLIFLLCFPVQTRVDVSVFFEWAGRLFFFDSSWLSCTLTKSYQWIHPVVWMLESGRWLYTTASKHLKLFQLDLFHALKLQGKLCSFLFISNSLILKAFSSLVSDIVPSSSDSECICLHHWIACNVVWHLLWFIACCQFHAVPQTCQILTLVLFPMASSLNQCWFKFSIAST